MAHPSTKTPVVEKCWILVGQRRGRIWFARRWQPTSGEVASVRFDGQWVLEREEQRGDVIGFYHTHPGGSPNPSQRDLHTMCAWCSCFGKPLLCLIESPEGLAAFRFDDDKSTGVLLPDVESFPRGVVVVVDAKDE